MKQKYKLTSFCNHRRLALLYALIVGAFFVSSAQVRVPFTQRTSQYSPSQQVYHVKGDFTMIGNTSLSLQNYGDLTQNGFNTMVYVDVDAPGTTGLGGTPTFNSSAATLGFSNENGAIPECSNIIFAGLYWTGRAHNSSSSNITFNVTKGGVTKNFDKRKIQLKGPTASDYTEFTAASNDIYYPTNMDDYMYSAFVEVTDYVQTHGIGDYMAADIALAEGSGGGTGYYGGWGLIVVYENSQMNYRDITIFDGHAFVVAGTASFDIPVSGFNTIQSGPVGVKIGVIAGEGDNGIAGDYLRIQKLNSTAYQNLNHSLNTVNNFFNSTIQTGGNPRNPNLLNNTGLDISMFDIPNPGNTVIGNSQTSTKFRYGSTGDTYIIFAVAMAVDAYIPEAEGILSALSINGTPAGSGPYTAEPGQTIAVKIDVKNKGSEAINNGKITIPIPYNATYIAGSATTNIYTTPAPTPNSIVFEPGSGANGSLVWNIGTLPLSENPDAILADATFEMTVTENCVLLTKAGCSNDILLQGSISGTGAITNVPLSNAALIQGYNAGGICQGIVIPGPLLIGVDAEDFVSQNCTGPGQSTNFVFCDVGVTIPLTAVSGAFPPGTLFYNQYPVVSGMTIQYTITNPFIATAGTTTYYAVPPGTDGCYYNFTITVASTTSVPIPQNVTYWVGATALPLTATLTNPGFNLYYFSSSTGSPHTSITPSTAVPGQTTYYVAEGPSPSCIGALVPIVVTVYEMGNLIAPNNAILYGCGTTPLTGLIYSPTPQLITFEQFEQAGGTFLGDGFPCDYTIIYTDSMSGNCPATITRIFTITDECGLFSTSSQQIVIGNNTPPQFAPLPQPQTIECGTPIQFVTAIATDDCQGILQATYNDVTTNECTGSYSITRTWTAVDNCGNIATTSQTIHVQDTTAPIITNDPVNITIECGAGQNAALTNWLQSNGGAVATDACSTVTWTNNFGELQIDCSQPITVTFTVTDDCGNMSQTTATLLSNDTSAPIPPAAPTNLTVLCTSEVPPSVTYVAIDNCQGVVSATNTDVVSPGNCASSFTITRTWTFSDSCSNTSQISQTITVNDSNPLEFNETLPGDLTLYCGTVPSPAILSVTTTCGDNIPVSFTENTIAGNCASNYEIIRTWHAVDNCGNHIKHSHSIIVSDNLGPELVGTLSQSLTVTCDEIPDTPELQFVDSCGSVGTIAFSENIINQNANTYTIIRTWSVPDLCNNVSTFTQTINVTEIVSESTASSYLACNTDISLSVDLTSLLPDGLPTDGSFTDLDSSGGLSGSVFTANGVDKGDYIITYESISGDCPTIVEITVTVDDDCLVLPACSLFVHNAFSPNGDGTNDIFFIENIDNVACYPTNSIEIYNRWGVLVYETNQYNNSDRSFKGVSEGRVTVNKSEELPTGTYFYLLQYANTDGSVTKKDGYLYLSR